MKEKVICAEQFQLEALEKQAREDLLRVGMSLLDEECIEIYNLLVELDMIKTKPPIEEYGTAFGGFCSQRGRLAGVMASMGRLGGNACAAAENRTSVNTPTSARLIHGATAPLERELYQSKCRLHIYAKELRGIGKELQRLSETDVQFIVCDARVLQEHPALAKAEAIRTDFSTSTDRLEVMSDRWWELAEKVSSMADVYEAALAANSSPYKIN